MKTWFKSFLTLLLVLLVQVSFAQQKTITGTVSDEGGPLPGANVIVKGTNNGTQTDFDGNYTLKASVGDVIVFSYVGMNNIEKTVDNQNVINVVLKSSNVLDEVVIIGFGQQTRKSALSSAVSTVTAKELEELAPSTSLDNMLQGKAAGVQVVAQNGKPGNGAFIRVRGVGSLNGGEPPLYIIDGVRASADDMAAINPSDVKEMSVLKDASTTAIYGAEGANGVVVITTHRGSNKEGSIRFQSRVGYSQKVADNFTMMNAEQKLQYEKELGIGTGASATDAEIAQLISQNHNWQDDLLKKGLLTSKSISFTGGTETSNYFASISNDTDGGIIDAVNAFNRITARLNLDTQVKEWLTLNLSFSATHNVTSDPRDRNNAQNPFRAMYDYNPYETLYNVDANGNIILDANGEPTYNLTHTGFPIAEAIRTNPESLKNTTFWASIGATIKLTDEISLNTRFSPKYNVYTREYFIEPGSILDGYVGDPDKPGIKTDNGSHNYGYSFVNQANWTKTFNEKHNVNVLALIDYFYTEFDSYSLSSKGFSNPDISVQSVAAEATAATTAKSNAASLAYAVKANYDFSEKYIATATFRREGNSRFGANSKFGNFWSASLAWNIAKENFMSSAEFVTDLKLRGSYGVTGNTSGIGRYSHLTTLGLGSYNNLNTLFPSQVGNRNLKWETSKQMDIGLEYKLFDGRLWGVVDYYTKKSEDLLQDRPLSGFGGFASITDNVGSLKSSGLEVEIGGEIIKTDNFVWTMGGNINFYSTKVDKLAGGNDIIMGNLILREGENAFTYYVPRYAGVNPANGDALYYDTEGNIVLDPSGEEVLLKGKTPFAKLDGGFYTSAKYKGFELSANFSYRYGNYIMNYMEWNMLSDGDNANDNQRVDAFNYWKNPGDTNVLPKPNNNSNQVTDRFLQDGSYIRLKSLTVGYTIPQSYLSKTPIDSFRIYFQGQNLWTYTPYYKGDPEVGIGSGETQTTVLIPGEFSLYSYPITQSYSFGIDIKF
ncbi:MAG: TonB-dependent receptor [Lutibacter sp.]|uniref:SusC/RagA family TonB-linked outer membrane protein n=1 Tax=Lutibacter sp. TaxID=1925666 RepID=UPI00299D0136|nr:TonB-dependent receptor [Lutibacter sp.]MDX1829984.1 TonB-dependent receptor [Lutibacter sp.]